MSYVKESQTWDTNFVNYTHVQQQLWWLYVAYIVGLICVWG